MSRQSQITEALQILSNKGAIQGFHKGHNESEPNRLEWFVQVNELELLYFSSAEAEAFINGAKSVMNHA
ncbi:MAG: hypothetical protein CMG34_07515 [Candidatus Marinimicrobia bacterium]|nr:hypothetical protein [Candidatus Neomarinimicrobiota bacterium]MBP01046.1 hypothetical protein [Candidatus Neomarinimicrobiota bacterium]|tara:strand:+ start:252 stop:458 length:207 start_codon:yes stop_codon:yes gene_type:complete